MPQIDRLHVADDLWGSDPLGASLGRRGVYGASYVALCRRALTINDEPYRQVSALNEAMTMVAADEPACTPDTDRRVWQPVVMGLDLRNLAIRCHLIGVARGGGTVLPTYGDLHAIFGGGYQNQGRFLETIYEDCIAHGEPDLTVLVINSATGRPSRFEGRPFQDSPDVLRRWEAAIERARMHPWSNLRFV